MFSRIRCYLSNCRKQGVTATEAPALQFPGERPAFVCAVKVEAE